MEEAEAFLSGKNKAVQARLVAEMNAASESLDFERAARLRDRLRALSHIQAHQGINPATFSDADLFAACVQGGAYLHPGFLFPGRPELG